MVGLLGAGERTSIRMVCGACVDLCDEARCVFGGPVGGVDSFWACAGDGFWGVGWVRGAANFCVSLEGIGILDAPGYAVGEITANRAAACSGCARYARPFPLDLQSARDEKAFVPLSYDCIYGPIPLAYFLD